MLLLWCHWDSGGLLHVAFIKGKVSSEIIGWVLLFVWYLSSSFQQRVPCLDCLLLGPHGGSVLLEANPKLIFYLGDILEELTGFGLVNIIVHGVGCNEELPADLPIGANNSEPSICWGIVVGLILLMYLH